MRGLLWLLVVAAIVLLASYGFGLPLLRTTAVAITLLFVFFYGHTRGQRAERERAAAETQQAQDELATSRIGVFAAPRRTG